MSRYRGGPDWNAAMWFWVIVIGGLWIMTIVRIASAQ